MKNIIVFLSLIIMVGQVVYSAKEIELKISVDEVLYPTIKQWLKEHAEFKGESEQREWYLTIPDCKWDCSAGFKDTLHVLRVRCESKGDYLCYKKTHLDPTTKKVLYRDEYETKIDDGVVIVQILSLMGYSEQTQVAKKRQTYLVRNTFEVVLDEVEQLGKFIEIELKVPVDNVHEGIAQIEELFKEMGITHFTEYGRSYVHMIWNPGYSFGTLRTL